MSALIIVPLLLVALALVLAAWYRGVRRYYRIHSSEDEQHHATTGDGFGVALARYRPREASRRHPVLLCGGLAANRFSYDLGGDKSFARHLADEGFDVWVMELRVHGRSRWKWPLRWGWDLDEHATEDVPAAIEAVRSATGADSVQLVGHSMGGILLYVHLSLGGGGVRSGVAIGSSLDYSSSMSWFHHVKGLAWLRHLLPAAPIGFVSTVTAPFAARGRSKLDEFNVWYSNIHPPDYRRLTAVTFHSVSTRVLAQLATAFDPGGLCSWDRSVRYIDGLRTVKTPVLIVGGTVDRQCPPEAARRTLDALGCEDKELALFGRAHGQADEYAHFDLLMGKRAREEVYPVITRWLIRHDADAAG